MDLRDLGSEAHAALEQSLGYLNFSSGNADSRFLTSINQLYEAVEGSWDIRATLPDDAWRTVIRLMQAKLDELVQAESAAFADATQAKQVLRLIEFVLPQYCEFHRDLLFHQQDGLLFRPFLLARFFEAILQTGGPWDDENAVCQKVMQRINDYVGYRPVAVLETQRCEVYSHEKVRPIPLYVRGVGAAIGRYQPVIERAIQMIEATDPDILRAAGFYPDHLEELCIDPRAYDFDHPVNKRPNYHFGQWDIHTINDHGFYSRFVIQQVTLESLTQRIVRKSPISLSDRITEAAAVLAGTILMASGITGPAPDAYDSNMTLAKLLPVIAGYRDEFYARLINQLPAAHQRRLKDEANRLRQPFGAARQHLNAELTKRRASQLEHVRLASIFARMGHPEAAQRRIDSIAVVSARMMCQIDCHLTTARSLVDAKDLTNAAQLLRTVRQLLLQGIQCGAFVDPWNLLGFDGNFSLFPAIENSVHDHRVDNLVQMVDEIFDCYAHLWSAAAAQDDAAMQEESRHQLDELTRWWHQFAPQEVSVLDTPDPRRVFFATESVAHALRAWHQDDQSAGNIRFWAPHVESFDAPRAYCLVLEMLLARNDLVAAQGLLVYWVGQSDRIPLEHAEVSFQRLTTKWLLQALQFASGFDQEDSSPLNEPDWKIVRKFFDYLEANADELWTVPKFDMEPFGQNAASDENQPSEEESQDPNEEDDLFGAAYEDVVYRDSTDDGMESSLFDVDSSRNDRLDQVHDHIVGRLSFLNTLAKLRKYAAVAWCVDQSRLSGDVDLTDLFRNAWKHLHGIRQQLHQLMKSVSQHKLSRPTGDVLSMAEFDRQRMIKEMLLEQIILCCVDVVEAMSFVAVAIPDQPENEAIFNALSEEERKTVKFLRAAFVREPVELLSAFDEIYSALNGKPVLYVPLARSGDPNTIIEVRVRQQLIRTLLSWLPRLGMMTEARAIIQLVRRMERSAPVGPGAVTEFDDLFEMGYRNMVKTIIRAKDMNETQDLALRDDSNQESQLVSCLERMTESMLGVWLSHSRTLRLSVLERVKSAEEWNALVAFIQTYGADLFTQQFLGLANVRGILYQGVGNWLEQMVEHGDDELRLLQDLDSVISRDDAIRHLTVILEAVVENYPSYRDYNSTTTQSDRGDLLFNLLDFLRLLNNYERVVWNLRPVVLSHELLVRQNCNEAAQMWRRALTERTSDEANLYLRKLSRLQAKYAMRLPTVADRLAERFLRPMVIDRMRALVEPAMNNTAKDAFEILEEETALLMREPSGVGFEPPTWLLALEEEVQRVRLATNHVEEVEIMERLLRPKSLSIAELQAQIDSWTQPESL